MNKIYTDQIEKAHSLSDGIRQHKEKLQKQGISLHTETLDNCRRALEEIAQKQDDAEAVLKEIRNEAHKLLEQVKEQIADIKTPIKLNFPFEAWAQFGIADKR